VFYWKEIFDKQQNEETKKYLLTDVEKSVFLQSANNFKQLMIN